MHDGIQKGAATNNQRLASQVAATLGDDALEDVVLNKNVDNRVSKNREVWLRENSSGYQMAGPFDLFSILK